MTIKKEIKVSLFTGIDDCRPYSMLKIKENFLEVLKEKYSDEIKIEEKSVSFVPIPYFKGFYNRYLRYFFWGRKKYGAFNHILDHANAHLLLFWPKEVKKIVSIYDVYGFFSKPKNYLFKIFNASAIKRADFIIVCSNQTKEDLVRCLEIPKDKIRVVYIGVDHKIFKLRSKSGARKILNLPKDSKIILHVGDDLPRKNIKTLIFAFQELAKKNKKLLLILVGRMQDKKLSKTILRLSNLSEEKLSLLYNAADIFVFPSLYEGFGMPVLEAMASGCPVVCSDIPALKEVGQKAAVYFNPNDASNMRNTIDTILLDTHLKKELVNKGIKRSQEFSWEKYAKEHIDIYKNI